MVTKAASGRDSQCRRSRGGVIGFRTGFLSRNAHLDNIFLIGPMGSGKTSVGRRLAPLLGLEFIDLDEEIERRCGVEVAHIFDIEGEPGFRIREHALLDDLTGRNGIVLATGGGSILHPDNRRLLRSRGRLVYLRASVDQQLRRLEKDKRRPLLAAPDRRQRLETLASERNPVYEEMADLVVEAKEISPDRMARKLAKMISSPRTAADRGTRPENP